MRIPRLAAIAAIIVSACVVTVGASPSKIVLAAPAQVDIVGPSGSEAFGQTVLVLSNGNFAVADPFFDLPGVSDVGQVSLYNGADNSLISRVTGTSEFDKVGSTELLEVGTSDFVIISRFWANPAGPFIAAGAVTWVDGSAGLNGMVSAANSLVGTSSGEFLGRPSPATASVQVLANGNYIVSDQRWDLNPGITDVGAVIWGNGTSGTTGPVTAANSIHGTQTGDQVGIGTIIELANGNFVVSSFAWNGGVGAATWANGAMGSSFAVGVGNSLHGTTPDDHVASRVTALSNGHYVVSSGQWDRTSPAIVTDVGASTWSNGNGSTVGAVSPSNSLVGEASGDGVGLGGATALSNGNYVVMSPYWRSAAANAGAVTFAVGSGPITGTPTAFNSIVGSVLDDQVGIDGVTALTNGNYVVNSKEWDNGGLHDAGAATWGKGDGSVSGPVSTLNSLVGGTDNADVGAYTTALTNGNFVVGSPRWIPNPGAFMVGAVTWGSGTAPLVGTVGAGNSLVGSADSDGVGDHLDADGYDGIVPLANGNYVVITSTWDSPSAVNAGAVTWADGDTGIAGAVSASNSFVGSDANDAVGSGPSVHALPNGNYVVQSPDYDGSLTDVGASTWANGATGITGEVSASNSLVGIGSGHHVGSVVFRSFPDSTYSFRSAFGAATRVGLTGATGTVTSANSFIGSVSDIAAGLTSSHSVVIVRGGNVLTLFTLDVTPPVFVMPPAVAATAVYPQTSVVVTYATPSALDEFGATNVVCVPPSGSVFEVGTTTVNCTGTNAEGLTATTAFPVTVTGPPALGPDYLPLSPARLTDTRPGATTIDGLFAARGELIGGTTLELTVAGRGGVPADAVAAALNVTVTEAAGNGFLTVYPCGAAQPTASNLNYSAGASIPNAVVTKIGTAGNVCLIASQTLHLIVDVNGAFPTTTTYKAINPARLLETRPGSTTVDGIQQSGGAVPAGSVTRLKITGRAGIPADASAVLLNVTVTEPDGAGYATVFPCGTEPPTASNLNYTTGLTIPNLVISKIGADGSVCIFTQQATHLVADVNGFFPFATTYVALNPGRLLDTRIGTTTIDGDGQGAGVRATGTVTTLHVAGRGGVPANAATAVLNVTVTETQAEGYVTVYPCGIEPPLASNLNFVAGQTIPNAVITKIGTNGDVCLYNSQPTQLLTDVTGYLP